MYSVTENVYLDAGGNATHEAVGELILVRGAVVSSEQAEVLGLPALAKERNAQAVEQAKRAQNFGVKKQEAKFAPKQSEKTDKTGGK